MFTVATLAAVIVYVIGIYFVEKKTIILGIIMAYTVLSLLAVIGINKRKKEEAKASFALLIATLISFLIVEENYEVAALALLVSLLFAINYNKRFSGIKQFFFQLIFLLLVIFTFYALQKDLPGRSLVALLTISAPLILAMIDSSRLYNDKPSLFAKKKKKPKR